MGWFVTQLRRFRNDRSGTALVEFALSLPLMVLVSFVSIDGLRLMWSFQAATSGVHEAARYLARVVPGNACAPPVVSLSDYEARLRGIVGQSADGTSVFGPRVELVSLTARLDCVTGTGLRQSTVPVATVSAEVRMLLPLHRVFSRAGAPDAATYTARIEEQARIYGL